MRAAVLNRGEILVRDDVEEPKPGFGQVLVEVKACGICGSDLHFAKHGGDMLALGKQIEGMPDLGQGGDEVDLDRDVFMGHEFAVEVLEVGPDTEPAVAVGKLATSIPILMGMDGIKPIVFSNSVKAGYGERMLLSAPMLVEVPNGLAAEHAALTEPMAVGLHAVNKGRVEKGQGAIVLGCGPVGLAVIAALAARGDTGPIVAADFSPARRRIAEAMGAHVVVDPREETGWAAWSRSGNGIPPVVFEAIGVPGILNDILRAAPAQSRVVVVGVCMEHDTINPFFGISKELNVQFCLGYDPMEFGQSLRSIAEGEIDVTPMITGVVGLADVPGAFEALSNPEAHCKILVVPGQRA